LWDWERSQAAAPVGFDVVHFLLQEQFKDHAGAPTALAALRGASIAPLGRWYRDRGQVDATIQLYLCEILTRYVSDGGIDPTSSLRSRIATILTMLSLYPDITQNAAEEFHADA
jgi:hypothetical protein